MVWYGMVSVLNLTRTRGMSVARMRDFLQRSSSVSLLRIFDSGMLVVLNISQLRNFGMNL